MHGTQPTGIDPMNYLSFFGIQPSTCRNSTTTGGDCGTGGGIALAKSTSAKVRPSLRLESTGGSPPVGSVSFAFVRGRGGGDDSSSSTSSSLSYSSSSVGNVATAT